MDFYATAAEMFPVLFLAIAWDSGYFERLRKLTAADDKKRTIWKRPVVRWFGIVLCAWNIWSMSLALLVLAGLFPVPDWIGWRLMVMAGLIVSAGTLLARIAFDLFSVTGDQPADGGGPTDNPERQPIKNNSTNSAN